MIARSPAERRDHTTNDREPRAQRQRHRLAHPRRSPDTRASPDEGCGAARRPSRSRLREGPARPICRLSRDGVCHLPTPPLGTRSMDPSRFARRSPGFGKEVAAAWFETVTARAMTAQRRQLGSLRGGEAPRPRSHLPPRRKARRPGHRASMHRHTRCAPLRGPGRARRPRPWPAWNLRLRRRKLGGSDGATGLASGEARTSKASLLSTPTGCGTAKSDVRVRLMMSRTAPRIASMAAIVTGSPRPIRSPISAAALASAR